VGRNYLADIPGNFFMHQWTHASTASNGASIDPAQCKFVAPANLKVLSVWRVVDTNEATKGTATTSASYRGYYVYNGGTSGTATTAVASLAQTASQAASGSRALTTTANNTVSAGEILFFKIGASIGGASDDGTTAQAAAVLFAYELL